MAINSLKPIEVKGSLETVKRIAQRLNELMNYAADCGFVPANPLTEIKATLKPDELPELMNVINNAGIKRTTRCLSNGNCIR